MQKEITKKTDILDKEGHVIQPGWARSEVFNYERDKITSSSLRIKEWDFWEVLNDEYCFIFNIFDIGYAGVAEFDFTDFKNHETHEFSKLKLFTRGCIGNPDSWKYNEPLVFEKGENRMQFSREGDNIILEVDFLHELSGEGIKGRISLYKDPEDDAIVNLIPFDDPKHFVYAQKINCMPANGEVRIGDRTYKVSEDKGFYGVLDWTRAVFPYKNSWKWCSANGKVNGVRFGFNLDYGFGKESSKSMIFYNGNGHHLDKVHYEFHKDYLNKPIKITSNDDRVDLVLHPEYSAKKGVDVLILAMKGKIAYGYFTGKVVLDDGRTVEITKSDKLWGWAESFYQKW